MNITTVISEVLGMLLTILGLSIVVNRKGVSAAIEEITKNPGISWIWGFIVLTTGAIIVSLNNVWDSGLQTFITILGWLTIIKGVFIIVLPETSSSFYKKVNKDSILAIGGFIAFIVGLVLLYQVVM